MKLELAAEYLAENRWVHSVVLVAARVHRCWVRVWTFCITDASVSVHHCAESSTVICMVRKHLLLVRLTNVVGETARGNAAETNGQWVRRVAADCVLLDARYLRVVKLGRTVEEGVLVDAVDHLGINLLTTEALSTHVTLVYQTLCTKGTLVSETGHLVCEALVHWVLEVCSVLWLRTTVEEGCLVDAVNHLRVDLLTTAEALSAAECLVCETLCTNVTLVYKTLCAEGTLNAYVALVYKTLCAKGCLVCETLTHAAHVHWVLEVRGAHWLGATMEQRRLLNALNLWVLKLRRTVEERVLVDAIDHLGIYLLTTEASRLVCETLSAETLRLVRERLYAKTLSSEVLVIVALVRQGLVREALRLVCEALVETATHVHWVLEVCKARLLVTQRRLLTAAEASRLVIEPLSEALTRETLVVEVVHHYEVPSNCSFQNM